MVQTTKNKMAVAPRVFNSIKNLLEFTTSDLMLALRRRARSDAGHAGEALTLNRIECSWGDYWDEPSVPDLSARYPEHCSTGSRGYFGKLGSVAESWHK